MNRRRGAAGAGSGEVRKTTGRASASGVCKSAAAMTSVGAVTADTVMASGAASAAAGQPGQCLPGTGAFDPPSGAERCRPFSFGSAVARARHASHAQSACAFAAWAVEKPSGGVADRAAAEGGVIGTNWQTHMPGGVSNAGSVRKKTSTRDITSPWIGRDFPTKSYRPAPDPSTAVRVVLPPLSRFRNQKSAKSQKTYSRLLWQGYNWLLAKPNILKRQG